MCLVFEPLGKSLYDFIKDNKFKGFEIGDLREIVNQSLKAIEFLHSINLTHTDLKPENILLKSDKHEVITDEARIPIVSMHFCLMVMLASATKERDIWELEMQLQRRCQLFFRLRENSLITRSNQYKITITQETSNLAEACQV
jgi:serine/threonine protein kinase